MRGRRGLIDFALPNAVRLDIHARAPNEDLVTKRSSAVAAAIPPR